MKRAGQFTLVLLVACTAAAADTGIRTVLEVIESRYSVRYHGVPGLWLARPFMIGSGVGGLKMAEFEDLRVPPEDMDSLKINLLQALGPEWHPFVESWSKRQRKWSVIFMRPKGGGMQLLILDSESDEGVSVLQMNVSGREQHRWFDKTKESAGQHTGHGTQERHRSATLAVAAQR